MWGQTPHAQKHLLPILHLRLIYGFDDMEATKVDADMSTALPQKKTKISSKGTGSIVEFLHVNWCYIHGHFLYLHAEKQFPTAKCSRCLTVIDAFSIQHEDKTALRERELAIREKELELKKQKLDMEDADRKRRWEKKKPRGSKEWNWSSKKERLFWTCCWNMWTIELRVTLIDNWVS